MSKKIHGLGLLLLELALVALVLMCLKTPLSHAVSSVDALLQPDGMQTALAGLLRGHAR